MTTSLSLRRVGWQAHAFRPKLELGAAPCCESVYALLAVAAAYTGPRKMEAYRHTAPLYTNNKLTPVEGFAVPRDHPEKYLFLSNP